MPSSMFKDLDRVLDQVSRDKNMPKQRLIEAIESAFLTAARKKWGHLGELEAHYNTDLGEIELFQFKEVVEVLENPETQMTLEEAKKQDDESEVGDSIGVKMDPSVFGRIAAQAAKQVIIQKVRDAERDITYDEYKERVGEIVTGIVRRFERSDAIVDLGRAEGLLPKSEQVPGQSLRGGERIQAYFLRIDPESRGPIIILSRKDLRFVVKLFEMEVPEVAEGVVEIKAAAREPGLRTKVAVYSKDSDVDPVGACVGVRGSRVQNIVSELKGEKVDIIAWENDPAKFVCNSVSPAEVARVIIRERDNTMEVVVPDDQLSLAIGRKGHNVKLAAELTGWNIDVYSESKIDIIAKRSREILQNILGVDESTAVILYSHSFRTFEDIANSSLENLLEVPGQNKDQLAEIYKKAKDAVASGISTETIVAEMIKDEEVELAKKVEVEKLAKAQEEEKLAEEALAEEKAKSVDEIAVSDDLTKEEEPTLELTEEKKD